MTFFLDQRAHLTLTVHRSARRKLAALLERHDCVYEGTKAFEMMVVMMVGWFGRCCEST